MKNNEIVTLFFTSIINFNKYIYIYIYIYLFNFEKEKDYLEIF